jgi:photosystem II stability/assembly factor-like uncharacterized protein
MTRKRTLVFLLFGVAVLAAAAFLVNRSFSAGETTVSALAEDTHFHGIAVDPRDANRLYLATHHGVFTVGPDGAARRVSESEDDFMGFTPHPADPDVLYASGHPVGGGNLGFIVSRDGGRSWSKLADGVGGPVDFHQMDVSKADPSVVYGVYGDLQKSVDGGRSWSRVGPAPEGIIGLAASSKDTDRLYAATQRGLMVSSDGGRRWRPAHEARKPATMVHVTRDGTVYAFIAGTGLIRAEEPNLDWTMLGNGFGGEYVLHLAVGAGGEQRILYAVTVDPESRAQALHVSRDGGRSWSPLARG